MAVARQPAVSRRGEEREDGGNIAGKEVRIITGSGQTRVRVQWENCYGGELREEVKVAGDPFGFRVIENGSGCEEDK